MTPLSAFTASGKVASTITNATSCVDGPPCTYAGLRAKCHTRQTLIVCDYSFANSIHFTRAKFNVVVN